MAPLVLGIVLGDIFDKSLRRSLVLTGGDFGFYFHRPICVVLMLLCLGTLILSFGPLRRLVMRPFKVIGGAFRRPKEEQGG
jgi:putative tricarboxylic transport membrane protein